MGRNFFEEGGEQYARFRPGYPPSLLTTLAELAPKPDLAVDVGCGSGQLSAPLAEVFETVFAFDPSESQLAQAAAHPRIVYRIARAEALPLADETASVLAAAQAVHWFELDAFWAEARRILAPGGVLALITYGACALEADLQPSMQRFYEETMGPHWPAPRRLIDGGYRELQVPMEALSDFELEMKDVWSLERVLGYVRTWSAARCARAAGGGHLLEAFEEELTSAWGDPGRRRSIRWPLHLRAFRRT